MAIPNAKLPDSDNEDYVHTDSRQLKVIGTILPDELPMKVFSSPSASNSSKPLPSASRTPSPVRKSFNSSLPSETFSSGTSNASLTLSPGKARQRQSPRRKRTKGSQPSLTRSPRKVRQTRSPKRSNTSFSTTRSPGNTHATPSPVPSAFTGLTSARASPLNSPHRSTHRSLSMGSRTSLPSVTGGATVSSFGADTSENIVFEMESDSESSEPYIAEPNKVRTSGLTPDIGNINFFDGSVSDKEEEDDDGWCGIPAEIVLGEELWKKKWKAPPEFLERASALTDLIRLHFEANSLDWTDREAQMDLLNPDGYFGDVVRKLKRKMARKEMFLFGQKPEVKFEIFGSSQLWSTYDQNIDIAIKIDGPVKATRQEVLKTLEDVLRSDERLQVTDSIMDASVPIVKISYVHSMDVEFKLHVSVFDVKTKDAVRAWRTLRLLREEHPPLMVALYFLRQLMERKKMTNAHLRYPNKFTWTNLFLASLRQTKPDLTLNVDNERETYSINEGTLVGLMIWNLLNPLVAQRHGMDSRTGNIFPSKSFRVTHLANPFRSMTADPERMEECFGYIQALRDAIATMKMRKFDDFVALAPSDEKFLLYQKESEMGSVVTIGTKNSRYASKGDLKLDENSDWLCEDLF